MRRKIPWYYFPWLYHALKFWVRLGTLSFYRRVEQKGKRKYPVKGPKIIAVNHRNGLSDAILIASLLKEHPTFLTRADVFLHPLAKKALNWLMMIPVYRSRDGVDVIQKNKETFQFCIDELKDNKSIFIFPEGNHARQFKVRPLKKGLARIAFQAAEETNFSMPLHVVPVGISYSHYTHVRSRLLIWYGEAFSVEPYYELYQENPRKALVELTKTLREELKKLTLHISHAKEYDSIDDMQRLYTPDRVLEKGGKLDSEYDRLLASKEIVAGLELDPAAMTPWKDRVKTYWDQLKALNLRDHVIREAPFSGAQLIMSFIRMVLLSPFLLISALHHAWLYIWPYRFALNKFKDDQWHQSISMLFTVFPAVPYHILLFGLAWWITGSLGWSLVYIGIVIISAYISLELIRSWKIWKGRRRYMRLLRSGEPQASQLAAERERLVEAIREMVNSSPEQEKSGVKSEKSAG